MIHLTPPCQKTQRKQTNKNTHKGLNRPSLWRQPRVTGLFSSGSHQVAGWLPSGAKWFSSHSCDNIMALCRPGCPNMARRRGRAEHYSLLMRNRRRHFSKRNHQSLSYFAVHVTWLQLFPAAVWPSLTPSASLRRRLCSPPGLHSALFQLLSKEPFSLLHNPPPRPRFLSVFFFFLFFFPNPKAHQCVSKNPTVQSGVLHLLYGCSV